MLSSLLAGTASLPFAAYHFGRATLYYVPANMLAVPITAFWVMPWGLAALVLMPLGLEKLALVPMGWGIAALDSIARHVAAWPFATLPVAQSPPWGLALVAGGLKSCRARATSSFPVPLSPVTSTLTLELATRSTSENTAFISGDEPTICPSVSYRRTGRAIPGATSTGSSTICVATASNCRRALSRIPLSRAGSTGFGR